MEATRKTVADKLGPYLSHGISLTALMEWAELAILRW
jgi:hypothetical protein